MKKIMLLFAILFVVTGLARAGDFHPEGDAELTQNNIWSSVDFQAGSNVIVTSFRVLYDKSPDKVFTSLIDTNSFPSIHSNYDDAAVLTKETFDAIVAASPKDADAVKPLIQKVASSTGRQKGGRWTRYEYMNFNFPWPLSNRWSVQKVDVDESGAASGHYRYNYKMYVGNFTALSGYWELVPVEGKSGWTEFRGNYQSDAGIALPKFVTKAAAKTGLKRDVDDNRRALGSK